MSQASYQTALPRNSDSFLHSFLAECNMFINNGAGNGNRTRVISFQYTLYSRVYWKAEVLPLHNTRVTLFIKVIMFKCNICNKEYNSKRSLASHKNHHDPEYHHRAKLGAMSSQKNASIAGTAKIKEKSHIKQDTVFCKNCSQPLPYEKRSEEHTSELQSHHDLVCRL